jgi:hypothetical protein
MKELIAQIEEVKTLRNNRLILERQAKMLSEQEKMLAARIIEDMRKFGVSELNGVSVRHSIVPVITDWSALDSYIRENAAVDLLQKRLTPTAVRLRWEDGIEIPGVDRYEETKLAF